MAHAMTIPAINSEALESPLPAVLVLNGWRGSARPARPLSWGDSCRYVAPGGPPSCRSPRLAGRRRPLPARFHPEPCTRPPRVDGVPIRSKQTTLIMTPPRKAEQQADRSVGVLAKQRADDSPRPVPATPASAVVIIRFIICMYPFPIPPGPLSVFSLVISNFHYYNAVFTALHSIQTELYSFQPKISIFQPRTPTGQSPDMRTGRRQPPGANAMNFKRRFQHLIKPLQFEGL